MLSAAFGYAIFESVGLIGHGAMAAKGSMACLLMGGLTAGGTSSSNSSSSSDSSAAPDSCDESSEVSLAEHDDVFAAEQSSSEEADGPVDQLADLRCVTKQIKPLGKKVASTFVFWDTCCCVGPRSFCQVRRKHSALLDVSSLEQARCHYCHGSRQEMLGQGSEAGVWCRLHCVLLHCGRAACQLLTKMGENMALACGAKAESSCEVEGCGQELAGAWLLWPPCFATVPR